MDAHPRSKCLFFSFVAVALSTVAVSPCAYGQSGLPAFIEPPEGSVRFGFSVASGGDVNGDRHDDLFISDPGFEVDGVRVGRWFVYDGRKREIVWSVVGDEDLGREEGLHGFNICGTFIDDVNGDQNADLIVGRPTANDSLGIAQVFSGRTGEVLFELRGTKSVDLLGVDVSGVGDLNNDGIADVAIVVSYWGEKGRVSFRSGRDLSELYEVVVPFPRRVRGIGDRDQDGHDDAIISSYRGQEPQINIVSGRTSELITIHPPRGPVDDDFGYAVAGGADLTGDDVPDFIVKNGTNGNIPKALIYCGATLEILNTILPGDDSTGFALSLHIADINLDGRHEIVISDFYRKNIYEALTGRLLHWVPSNRMGPFWYGNETAVGDFNGDGFMDIAAPIRTGGVMLYGANTLLVSPSTVGRDFDLERDSRHGLTTWCAAPGRRVHFLASLSGHSCTFIKSLGICIDLERPVYRLGSAVTNAEGFTRINFSLGPGAPLRPAWIQAIDPADPQRGPVTSNVMQIEIAD